MRKKTQQDQTETLIRFILKNPSLTLVLFSAVILLVGMDLVELIPWAKPLAESAYYEYLHETHDGLAVILSLFIAYRWGSAIGGAALALYVVGHIPYFYFEEPRDWPEYSRIFAEMVFGLFGIVLIKRLHLSIETANERLEKVVEAENASRHMALHDPLTDLPNRKLFKERVMEGIAQSRRDKGQLAVLHINLDRFKDVNDTLGHHIGDQLLIKTANRLRLNVRETDTVAHLGGDEFAVLESNLTDLDGAAILAQKLIAVISEKCVISDHLFYLTPSIGIAVYPFSSKNGADTAENAGDLLKQADIAMYTVKGNGGNDYHFYDDIIDAQVQSRMTAARELQGALERKELSLLYQPIVKVSTGEIVRAEALIRWVHPKKGIVSPADFIPIAEATGLIVPIGEWVLRKACSQNQSWQNAGLPSIRIDVNLSVVQLKRQNIIELVDLILKKTGLNPVYLDLEVTESLLMEDLTGNARAFQGLSSFGVRISIDDFGTGYSSLDFLANFSANSIKIDRTFIKKLGHKDSANLIVKTIVGLSHSLGMEVVAEGVESEYQINFLRKIGCDQAQGYYFSPPVPAEIFTGYLRKKAS